MKINARDATRGGVHMTSDRRTALIAGVWFIITVLTAIPALLIYDPVLNDADYILGAGADTRIAFGAFLEILLAIANIATAVVLFPVRHSYFFWSAGAVKASSRFPTTCGSLRSDWP